MSTKTLEKIKNIYIFEDLKDRELEKIYAIAKRRNFMTGEVVVFEGDEGDSCFLLVRGAVAVSKLDEKSGDDKLVGRLGRGAVFGEMALLGLYTRTATVTTLEDSEVLEIEGALLGQVFYDDPQLGMTFYRAMARGLVTRLRDTTDEVSFLKAT